ncbi:uncharacterized protein LOC126771966 isoform X2 [Nymphalis io]|uniref:uncharacterized protein LOC126771966 isoform X2 n=1 Tax=Inachis io TaxID=171585 RepID=UPI002167E04F|nr:uncharacterized protein LOC126771966 isoform X2 [Nymphalis io]
MFSILYFMVSITLLYKCTCFYKTRNLNAGVDELRNNLETFVRPIKKLTGIFPNHEIEVQFDIERNYDTGASRKRFNKKDHSHEIIRKKNIIRLRRNNMSTLSSISDTIPPNTETTALPSNQDQDNQIVYMKDLKKALENFEKKHNIINDQEAMQPLLKKDLWMVLEHCNQGARSNEKVYSTTRQKNSPQFFDIINTLKKSGQIHNDIPKPNEEELSWLKIEVPA